MVTFLKHNKEQIFKVCFNVVWKVKVLAAPSVLYVYEYEYEYEFVSVSFLQFASFHGLPHVITDGYQ
jgi:hypothetical protein